MLPVHERVEKGQWYEGALRFVLEMDDVEKQVHSYNLCGSATHFSGTSKSSESLQVEGRAYSGKLAAIVNHVNQGFSRQLLEFSARSLRIFQRVERAPHCFSP